MKKKLYRSHRDRRVLGIFGGLGEYWDVDPALLRLAYVAFMFMTGLVPLLLGYLVGYFIIPPAPSEDEKGP